MREILSAPASNESPIGEFLAARGGPFYELQRRLGMLHEDALRAGSRAAILVGVAWGIPLFLTLAETGTVPAKSYLIDLGAWARFFFAVGLFILVEPLVERRLHAVMENLVHAPILEPSSFPLAAEAVSAALRRRDSRFMEAICLVLGLAISLAVTVFAFPLEANMPLWAMRGSAGNRSLSLAGWWCRIVSLPLFWFLLLRGVWRHFIWSMLLQKLSRLDLRLVATHPDGSGGLAFIGQYPNAYAMFIWGISCVVGAILAHQFKTNDLSLALFSVILISWLLIVLGMFALSLLPFSKPLAELKEGTLLEAGAQATRYHRFAERKLLGRNIAAVDAEEALSDTAPADPSKHFDAARKLSTFLMQRSALLPLAAAALLPLAASGATKLPYKEVISILKKLLLF